MGDQAELSDRYEIQALVGKGHLGGVYEARDTEMNRQVAMRRFFDRQGNYPLRWEQEQALLEAVEAAAKVTGPGKLRIFDWGRDEEGVFIVSELLPGRNLSDLMEEGVVSRENLLRFADEILRGMDQAHLGGIILGYLDGRSIRVVESEGKRESFCLIDFGWERVISEAVAKLRGAEAHAQWIREACFAAPELLAGEEPSVVTDLYALGQILFMLAAGGHPMSGMSVEEVVAFHYAGNTMSLEDFRDDLEPGFIEWLHGLIAPDPKDRHATAQIAYVLLNGLSDFPRGKSEEAVQASSDGPEWVASAGKIQGKSSPTSLPAATFAGQGQAGARGNVIGSAVSSAQKPDRSRLLLVGLLVLLVLGIGVAGYVLSQKSKAKQEQEAVKETRPLSDQEKINQRLEKIKRSTEGAQD